MMSVVVDIVAMAYVVQNRVDVNQMERVARQIVSVVLDTALVVYAERV